MLHRIGRWFIDQPEWFTIPAITISGVLLFVGLISGIAGLKNGSENRCTHESVLAYVAVPYYIGCELARPRFKKTNSGGKVNEY